MSHQTIQHHEASQNDEKLWLISGSQRLSWKVRITPNAAMFLRKWLSCVLRVTLIGALAISGCTSKDSGKTEARQTNASKSKESIASKPVHKEVGEASWYGPGFQGQETANGETFNQKDDDSRPSDFADGDQSQSDQPREWQEGRGQNQ